MEIIKEGIYLTGQFEKEQLDKIENDYNYQIDELVNNFWDHYSELKMCDENFYLMHYESYYEGYPHRAVAEFTYWCGLEENENCLYLDYIKAECNVRLMYYVD